MSTPESGTCSTLPASPQPVPDPTRRATLVRAGLAGAFVLGSLQPGRVLAWTNEPMDVASKSMWNSLTQNSTTLLPSQLKRLGKGTVRSPDNWKGRSTYTNFPSRGANTQAVNTLFSGASSGVVVSAGFSPSDSQFDSKTLKDVLNLSAPLDMKVQLARFCVAMLLNACESGDNLLISPVSKATVLDIWSNGGKWTPVSGGPEWLLAGTLDYFTYITGGRHPWRS